MCYKENTFDVKDLEETLTYWMSKPEDEVVRETVTLVTACDKQTETNRPFEESSSSGEDSEATPSDSPSQRFSAGIAFHTGVEMVREVVQRRH
ncbi:UNVERIFIED_CONTAM: hypothetical protein FKN15_056640 [Acipenser sinensis]